jgi:hypothetical protein
MDCGALQLPGRMSTWLDHRGMLQRHLSIHPGSLGRTRIRGGITPVVSADNKSPPLVLAAVTGMAAATQLIPQLSALLRFEPIGWRGLLAILAVMLFAITLLQQLKLRWSGTPGEPPASSGAIATS